MSINVVDANVPSTGTVVKPDVKVSQTVSTDLPDLAVCELLAFSGDPSTRSEDPIAQAMFPFRAPLVRSGVHPRFWPDYDSTIRRRARELRYGYIMFTAFVRVDKEGNPVSGVDNDEGRWVPAGMAKMTPPQSVLDSVRKTLKWTDRMLDDVVYPTVDAVRDKLLNDTSGMDTTFRDVFKKAQAEYRKKHITEREYYMLDILLVHPKYQNCGVGSALLGKCISVASALEPATRSPSLLSPPSPFPLFLEATREGIPLYIRRGFVAVEDLNWSWRGKDFKLTIMTREPDTKTEPEPELETD